MELTSDNVRKVLLDCLFDDGADTATAVLVHGIMNEWALIRPS